MYCNRKIACRKPQCCLLIARAFTFVNEQTVLLRPFFRSKNREKVSVSAMLVSMRQKKSLKFLFLSDIFLFPPIRQQVPILA